MDFLIDFVDSISSIFGAVWNFFTGLIDNFVQFFEYIGVAVKLCYNLVASLPTWLSAFALPTVLICTIFIILGRQTGGAKSDK